MPPGQVKRKRVTPGAKIKGKGRHGSPNPPPPESPSSLTPCTESQPWDCEDGPLPSGDDDETMDDNLAASSQAKNASSPHWAPWQDRLLAQQAYILQPFLKPPRQIKVAWDALVKALLEESTKLGPNSIIKRSGDSCHARFDRLVKFQRVRHCLDFPGHLLDKSHCLQGAETRAKQATGTDEEVNDHIKVRPLPVTQMLI